MSIVAPQCTGKWSGYYHYRVKIGTHSTSLAVIRSVRSFSVGQNIQFVELSSLQGVSKRMRLSGFWQWGQIHRITSTHIFIDR